MALGDSYASLAELKTRLAATGSGDDTALTNALAVASRGIEHVCRRQFNQATSATARVYYPCDACLSEPDDFYTTTGLIVATDGDNDGVYETTWASTDYQREPLNGIVNGESGWPTYRLRAVASRYFPARYGSYTPRRAPLQVTAQWGWSAVPAGVKEACLTVAEETFKLKDAPYGVIGMSEWGAIRVRANPMAMMMIGPYCRDLVLVA